MGLLSRIDEMIAWAVRSGTRGAFGSASDRARWVSVNLEKLEVSRFDFSRRRSSSRAVVVAAMFGMTDKGATLLARSVVRYPELVNLPTMVIGVEDPPLAFLSTGAFPQVGVLIWLVLETNSGDVSDVYEAAASPDVSLWRPGEREVDVVDIGVALASWSGISDVEIFVDGERLRLPGVVGSAFIVAPLDIGRLELRQRFSRQDGKFDATIVAKVSVDSVS